MEVNNCMTIHYCLVSAEGGINDPSMAHMTVVERAESPTGPRENSPYNPLVHTYMQGEKWWHQGHGTISEAADGTWWTVYHARRNGFGELGRSTLLFPVEWTPDGWTKIKNGYNAADLIPMPNGENLGNGMTLSDNFSSGEAGMQWNISQNMIKKVAFANGVVVFRNFSYQGLED